MSITTTFRNTSQITIDEISEMFPKQGRFNTELNELRAAKVDRDETIKMVEIPQSLMPMLCRYKSIMPPNSHVDAFELNGTVKLVAQLGAENAALKEAITPAQALDTLSEAFRKNPDYAHSWHCNIAMACIDAMPAGWVSSHEIGNDAASRFMKNAFNVETDTQPEGGE